MTKTKGKGWHGNPEAHARNGRLGGLKTAKKHGIEHYQRIGKIGGKKTQNIKKLLDMEASEETTE